MLYNDPQPNDIVPHVWLRIPYRVPNDASTHILDLKHSADLVQATRVCRINPFSRFRMEGARLHADIMQCQLHYAQLVVAKRMIRSVEG